MRRSWSWRAAAKKFLPVELQNCIRRFIRIAEGLPAYAGDFRRFFNYSGIRRQGEEGRLRARITAQYHVIEKGLSHHAARPGFGKDMVAALVASLQRYYEAGYRASCSQYQSALAVLESYREYNRSQNAQIPREVDDFLQRAGGMFNGQFAGGHDTKRGEDLLTCWRRDFRSLATNRHSIRCFSTSPIEREAILRAVDLARSAPSACNRQPARVHMFKNKQKIREILAIQGGANGFVELIDTLLIITVDLRGYFGFAERNLGYVDGGLFAMALTYALCYEGIGSCLLHLALSRAQEEQLREMACLPDTETAVVMLGAGRVPEALKVAHSQRKPLDEYVGLH